MPNDDVSRNESPDLTTELQPGELVLVIATLRPLSFPMRDGGSGPALCARSCEVRAYNGADADAAAAAEQVT